MDKSWQTNKGLAETNLHLLNEEILCDVTFLVGESRREVKAHKYMLVSRSPVFYAMFCGPMAESRDIIEIPDVEKDSFHQLLRFFYSENCDITADIVMSLLYVGKKYEVAALAEKCKSYLESEMSPDNVCVILQQAHTFDEHDLVTQSLTYVLKNGNTVLKCTGFISLRKDVLHLIVESDKLQVKEKDIYLACVRWAEEKCRKENKDVNNTNIRDALGLDLIKQIRFPCMQLNVFSKIVGERRILTSDEKVDVYLEMTSGKERRTSLFKNKLRILEKKRVNIQRLVACKSIWSNSQRTDGIEFESSTDVELIGVSLYTPAELNTTACKVEVLENDGNSLISMNTILTHSESSLFQDIVFDSPVMIDKNTRYTVKQTAAGTHYGQNGTQSVKAEEIQIQFFKCNFYNNSTGTTKGQFHRLIFQI